MPKEKKRVYGKYWEFAPNGKLRAVAHIPLGNGKYKKIRSRLSDNINTKQDALQWALEMLEQGEQKENFKTCAELFDWFQSTFLIPAVYDNKGAKLYGYRNTQPNESRLNRLREYFGGYKLHKVTGDTILAFKRMRLKKIAVSALNRELSLFNYILKKAKMRKWIRENPFDYGENLIESSLEQYRKPEINDRIAVRLIARSRKSASDRLFYLLMFLAHTGARPSEAYPFTMNDNGVPIEPVSWNKILQYDFKMVTLVSYKGRIKTERLVPVPEQLERVMRELYRKVQPSGDELIFPQRTYKSAFNKVRESIKCPTVRMRDFRAYYNSTLVKRGFNDMVRMKILGHKSLQMNFGYTQLDETFVKTFRKGYDVQEFDGVN